MDFIKIAFTYLHSIYKSAAFHKDCLSIFPGATSAVRGEGEGEGEGEWEGDSIRLFRVVTTKKANRTQK